MVTTAERTVEPFTAEFALEHGVDRVLAASAQLWRQIVLVRQPQLLDSIQLGLYGLPVHILYGEDLQYQRVI